MSNLAALRDLLRTMDTPVEAADLLSACNSVGASSEFIVVIGDRRTVQQAGQDNDFVQIEAALGPFQLEEIFVRHNNNRYALFTAVMMKNIKTPPRENVGSNIIFCEADVDNFYSHPVRHVPINGNVSRCYELLQRYYPGSVESISNFLEAPVLDDDLSDGSDDTLFTSMSVELQMDDDSVEDQCDDDVMQMQLDLSKLFSGAAKTVASAAGIAKKKKPEKKTPPPLPPRRGKVNPATAGDNLPTATTLNTGFRTDLGSGSTVQTTGDASITRVSNVSYLIQTSHPLSIWPKKSSTIGYPVDPKYLQSLTTRRVQRQCDDGFDGSIHENIDCGHYEQITLVPHNGDSTLVSISKRPMIHLLVDPSFSFRGWIFKLSEGYIVAKRGQEQVQVTFDTGYRVSTFPIEPGMKVDEGLFIRIGNNRFWKRQELRIGRDALFVRCHRPMIGHIVCNEQTYNPAPDVLDGRVLYDTGSTVNFTRSTDSVHELQHSVRIMGFEEEATLWNAARNALVLPSLKREIISVDATIVIPTKKQDIIVELAHPRVQFHIKSGEEIVKSQVRGKVKLATLGEILECANEERVPPFIHCETDDHLNFGTLDGVSFTYKFRPDKFFCVPMNLNGFAVYLPDTENSHVLIINEIARELAQRESEEILGVSTSQLAARMAAEMDRVQPPDDIAYRSTVVVHCEADDNDPIIRPGKNPGFIPPMLGQLEDNDQGLAATILAPGAQLKGMKALPLGTQRVASTQSIINQDSVKALEGYGGNSHLGVMATTNMRAQVAIIGPAAAGNYIISRHQMGIDGLALSDGFEIGCASEGLGNDTYAKSITPSVETMIITPTLCAGTTKDATGLKIPSVVYNSSGTPVPALPQYAQASGVLVGHSVTATDRVRVAFSMHRENGGTATVTPSVECDFIDTAGTISTVTNSGLAYTSTIPKPALYSIITPPANCAALLQVRCVSTAATASIGVWCENVMVVIQCIAGASFNKSVPYGDWLLTPSKTYQTVVQNQDQPTHKYACQGSALLISNTSNLLNVSGNAVSAVLPPGSPEYYGVSPNTIGSTLGTQSAPFADGAYLVMNNTPQNIIQGISHNIQEQVRWDGATLLYLASLTTTATPLSIRVVSTSFWSVITSLQMLKPKNLELDFDAIENLVNMFKSGDMLSTNKSHLSKIKSMINKLYELAHTKVTVRNLKRQVAAKGHGITTAKPEVFFV